MAASSSASSSSDGIFDSVSWMVLGLIFLVADAGSGSFRPVDLWMENVCFGGFNRGELDASLFPTVAPPGAVVLVVVEVVVELLDGADDAMVLRCIREQLASCTPWFCFNMVCAHM